MSDQFVSIQAENGQVVTVSATWAKATRAKVLKDEPAVDRFGAPLGPRQSTAQPAKKTAAKTAKKATTRKRASKRTSKKSTASSTSMTSQSSGGAGAASTPEEASK